MEESTNTPESNVKSTIDAVTGLVQAIPVYQDSLQPAAKQIGQSLEVVAKTVNIALAPIKALVWGYEQIEGFITTKVAEKLKNIPKENIITPPPQVAVPAAEALRYTGHEENLRELYANLIATAMDNQTANKAHPAYVDIIKSMTSDEAIFLKVFIEESTHPLIDINAANKTTPGHFIVLSNFSKLWSGISLKHPDLLPAYIDNLCRLGLLQIPIGSTITDKGIYESIENDELLDSLKETITKKDRKVTFTRKIVQVTTFGQQFINNVVIDKK